MRSDYPLWWLTRAFAVAVLVPALALAQPAPLPRCSTPVTQTAALLPRVTAALNACSGELRACRGRVCPECPEPLPPMTQRVEVERIAWWPVVVAGVAAFLAGGYAGWRVSR
jgi:hypothetical protein